MTKSDDKYILHEAQSLYEIPAGKSSIDLRYQSSKEPTVRLVTKCEGKDEEDTVIYDAKINHKIVVNTKWYNMADLSNFNFESAISN